jgi:flagellar P-ring protein precursor FlgI
MKTLILNFILIISFSVNIFAEVAVPLKQLIQVEGARDNQLQGYGIVVGLEGTGDSKKSLFTTRSIVSMLKSYGVNVLAEDIKVDNAAAVMVTMTLKPFAREGQRYDVVVSSIGDAENLQGGELLQTPLFGADNEVYAVAQGRVSIGGFNIKSGGANIRKNHPTVGRVPEGGIIEQTLTSHIVNNNSIRLLLNNADYMTAAKITEAINLWAGQKIAVSEDAGSIRVMLTDKYINNPVLLVAQLSKISVVPDKQAKIVMNTRTGTIVIGEGVRLSKAAIAHGNLSVVISPNISVSQPAPLSEGETVEVSQPEISVSETGGKVMVMNEGSTIGDVVKALNSIGASPRDIISIIQALKEAGSLYAKIELI